MRTSVRLIGAAAATAGLMALGSPAFASGHGDYGHNGGYYDDGNDGINILNDNNVSVAPIQACGNNVAVLGIAAPIASPQYTQCVNAPVVDAD
ncbi:hypothetical protein [Haloactinomyces albus]|uniref:Chaplin domain-containing protein n=1 Tax=Haloactinomyces albus TaxID=1352928 RepID=A0AAE3Z951_9ACTN|nr:hypothetical protein [Haloactinomyces albus]MDR7300618.1 hypothetical protein [Haloactinomyces albus]